MKNPNKVYLFKSGNFYIFLGDDAKIMSVELGLKLTNFSKMSDKCGFPINQLDKYEKFIKLLKFDYEVILSAGDFVIQDILKLGDITKEEALIKINKYKKVLSEDE